jgi:hypothetical protein
MTPAVEVVDLVKRYPTATGYRDLVRRSRAAPGADTGRPALGGVSLKIAPGELFGLLGQNGAGKTTLIRILTTALRPTSGTARVAGHDVERDTMQVRRSIGLISGEERSFYWRMTGRQNLVFFAAIAHIPLRQRTTRIEELLERVNLTAAADRLRKTSGQNLSCPNCGGPLEVRAPEGEALELSATPQPDPSPRRTRAVPLLLTAGWQRVGPATAHAPERSGDAVRAFRLAFDRPLAAYVFVRVSGCVALEPWRP